MRRHPPRAPPHVVSRGSAPSQRCRYGGEGMWDTKLGAVDRAPTRPAVPDDHGRAGSGGDAVPAWVALEREKTAAYRPFLRIIRGGSWGGPKDCA